MRSSRLKFASLMAIAAAAMAGAGMSVQVIDPSGHQMSNPAPRIDKGTQGAGQKAQKSEIKRAFTGSYGGWTKPTYPGYGWSVAHDRRQAKKARNKARNRAAQR